jgi:hypothetical protein
MTPGIVRKGSHVNEAAELAFVELRKELEKSCDTLHTLDDLHTTMKRLMTMVTIKWTVMVKFQFTAKRT